MDDSEPKWSDEELRVLRHEAFVAAVLQQPSRKSSAASDKPKSLWEVTANSSVLTALVTILGTAVFGNLIAARIQDRMKSKELAVLERKEQITQRLGLMRDTYQLLGSYLSASEDLVTLTQDEFDLSRYQGKAREQVASQRERIRKEYNTLDSKWRRERISLGFLIAFHHGGRLEISRAWNDVEQAVDGYNRCATKLYLNGPTTASQEKNPRCINEKAAAEQKIAELAVLSGFKE